MREVGREGGENDHGREKRRKKKRRETVLPVSFKLPCNYILTFVILGHDTQTRCSV